MLFLTGVPDDVGNADYTVRPRRPVVVNNRRVTLHPDPASVLDEKPEIPRRYLSFDEHCNRYNGTKKDYYNTSSVKSHVTV